MFSPQDKLNNNKQDEKEMATLVVINPAFSAAALFDQITLCLQTIVLFISNTY